MLDGREAKTSLIIIEAQSVKNSDTAEESANILTIINVAVVGWDKRFIFQPYFFRRFMA